MFIAYIIVAILMSALLVMSSTGKLRKDPKQVHSIHEVVGVPMSGLPWLAACEIAGAVGLLVGIFWWPLSLAAAIGVVIYFIGAVVGHLLAKDFKHVTTPLIPFIFAVVVLVLRLLSI
jgi:uncharacterized membrane protein YphA (DoxX/SURF4 family)